MSTKRRGLGKGLNALFMDNEHQLQPDNYESAEGKEFFTVDINQLYPNPEQPRKNFNLESLHELADSIRIHGIIQPLIVVSKDDGYMIIAGERRYRAAQLADYQDIPVIVKEYDDVKIQEISLIENLQREDLNPIEAAQAINKLMKEHSYTQEAVAERLGKSRPAIANTLRLLNLPKEVREYIFNGRLTAGHARALVVLNDESAQIKLAAYAAQNNLSVRDVENAVKKILNPPPAKPKAPPISAELEELVSVMQRVFATKISAVGNDRKGRIYIDYYTRDDLERIYQDINLIRINKNL